MTNGNSCCTPARGEAAGTSAKQGAPSDVQGISPATEAGVAPRDCVRIPGGLALVGTARPYLPADGEGPLRRKKVSSFFCERGTVTNAAFARFVADTGYVTDAERLGWSFVFVHLVPDAIQVTQGISGLEWWRRIEGACWHNPSGPEGAAPPPDHPVVQVSWSDAKAYARWAGGHLPTEAEWEHAARGGMGDVPFPWGETPPNDTEFTPCNIWQGQFPQENTCRDGYMATAPALSFEPNGYGLHHVVGNVWEWTSEPFKLRSLKRQARQVNAKAAGTKLLKGGSFLCHASYCLRYRIAARSGNTPDSAASHMGFRVIYDSPPRATATA